MRESSTARLGDGLHGGEMEKGGNVMLFHWNYLAVRSTLYLVVL